MSEKTFQFTKSFKQPPEKVWGFLTESEKLSRWFLPNDFSLVEKDDFRLWTTPTPAWDGVLLGKVNDYVENKSLSYELKTSISSETSQVDWTIDEGHGGSHLNLSHEGSDILIDTIYKAINGTQVSGHIHREQIQKTPIQSDILIKNTEDKPFLDQLRSELLHDPENIEFAVSKTVSQYPSYLDQIVCLAVDAFPEKAMKILDAAKSVSGGNFQRLLGLTLFLLLFKDAISDAQAANAAEKMEEAVGEDDLTEDELSFLSSEEDEFAGMMQEFKGQVQNGNIRAAFGIAVAMIILVTAEPAIAETVVELISTEEVGTLAFDEDAEVILNDVDGSVNAQDIIAALPEFSMVNNQIIYSNGVYSPSSQFNTFDFAKNEFQSIETVTERKVHKKNDDGFVENHGEALSQQATTEILLESDEELLLNEGEFVFPDEYLFIEEEGTPLEGEIYWVDSLLDEWHTVTEFDEEEPYEDVHYEDDVEETDVAYIDDEYVEGPSPEEIEEGYNSLIEEILSFVFFVEDKVGDDVLAVVMTDEGPELFFEKENLELFMEEENSQYMDIFIVDSQTLHEGASLNEFGEIESYSTVEYIENLPDGNSCI